MVVIVYKKKKHLDIWISTLGFFLACGFIVEMAKGEWHNADDLRKAIL